MRNLSLLFFLSILKLNSYTSIVSFYAVSAHPSKEIFPVNKKEVRRTFFFLIDRVSRHYLNLRAVLDCFKKKYVETDGEYTEYKTR